MKKLITLTISLSLLLLSCQKDGEHMDRLTGIGAYSGENYTEYGENPFVSVADQQVSTFSIDADGASYSNMRRFLLSGSNPPSEAIRVEEFINYFNYDYPEPVSENVSMHSEVSICPWNARHHLMRVGLKGISIEERPPSNIVFLIDVSGSMESSDKLNLLKTGLKMFVDQLTDADHVSIVTYAGSSGIALNPTSGDQKSTIKNAIDNLSSGGSTAGAEGINTAYHLACLNFKTGGNNRVVLGTDGDFNVGPSSTDELVNIIEAHRKSGVFLTVLGVGTGNLNDAMMEQLADNGNGNFEYLDNVNQLKKVFVYEYDKFFTVAKDAKIQVHFNSLCVDSFRLIGYENRILDETEFEDDSTDAGEIGAGQCITALYELVPKENPEGALARLQFRYKMPDESASRLMNVSVENNVVPFDQSTENMRFAACVAGFGMLLKDSQYSGTLQYSNIISWASNAKTFDPFGFRTEFTSLVSRAN